MPNRVTDVILLHPMSRRPLLLRALITLVAAWYSLIAGGQLSLAERAVTSTRVTTESQSSQSMPHGAAMMAAMDCHRASFPDGKKHLCLCIDTGCFPLSVALPTVVAARHSDARTLVRVIVPRVPVVGARADDYLIPPATAPPQA